MVQNAFAQFVLDFIQEAQRHLRRSFHRIQTVQRKLGGGSKRYATRRVLRFRIFLVILSPKH